MLSCFPFLLLFQILMNVPNRVVVCPVLFNDGVDCSVLFKSVVPNNGVVPNDLIVLFFLVMFQMMVLFVLFCFVMIFHIMVLLVLFCQVVFSTAGISAFHPSELTD